MYILYIIALSATTWASTFEVNTQEYKNKASCEQALELVKAPIKESEIANVTAFCTIK